MADILKADETAIWIPLVRDRLGVDEIELPDATVNNAILVELSEFRVKGLITDWSTQIVTYPAQLKMAAICFLAAHFTDWCEKNILALEYEANYRSERQKIDWSQKYTDLVAEAFGYLSQVDPNVALGRTYCTVISKATPLFEETT